MLRFPVVPERERQAITLADRKVKKSPRAVLRRGTTHVFHASDSAVRAACGVSKISAFFAQSLRTRLSSPRMITAKRPVEATFLRHFGQHQH